MQARSKKRIAKISIALLASLLVVLPVSLRIRAASRTELIARALFQFGNEVSITGNTPTSKVIQLQASCLLSQLPPKCKFFLKRGFDVSPDADKVMAFVFDDNLRFAIVLFFKPGAGCFVRNLNTEDSSSFENDQSFIQFRE